MAEYKVRFLPMDTVFPAGDGENLLEAARKLQSMVTAYDHLSERVAEIQALELSTAETQRLVTRVLASQTLPREDVDKQQTRLRDALSKISTEIDRRAAINTRHLADRERLAGAIVAFAESLADHPDLVAAENRR